MFRLLGLLERTELNAVLVCQSSSKVVLDVGVHDRSEVVEAAVPEQVNDEHLNTHVYEDVTLHHLIYEYSYSASFNVLPVTGKPAVHIYQCFHLKDRRAYPGHLVRTVRKKETTISTTIAITALMVAKIETKGSPSIRTHHNKRFLIRKL